MREEGCGVAGEHSVATFNLQAGKENIIGEEQCFLLIRKPTDVPLNDLSIRKAFNPRLGERESLSLF